MPAEQSHKCPLLQTACFNYPTPKKTKSPNRPNTRRFHGKKTTTTPMAVWYGTHRANNTAQIWANEKPLIRIYTIYIHGYNGHGLYTWIKPQKAKNDVQNMRKNMRKCKKYAQKCA